MPHSSWLPADLKVVSLIKKLFRTHFDHVYFMNPIDWSFHTWAKDDNGHPLDDNRFYKFVRTVHHYKKDGSIWRTKEKFSFECSKYNFSEEKIDYKYDLLIILLDFLEYNEGPFWKTKRYIENRQLKLSDRYIQKMYLEDCVEEIEITKEEFDKRKVGKREFIRRINK